MPGLPFTSFAAAAGWHAFLRGRLRLVTLWLCEPCPWDYVRRNDAMSTPYIGEIRMTGFNFAPVDWALCNGQLISISQNTTLFQVIGTTYGGDGENTFALPNLQSRFAVHQGSKAGNTLVLGESGGSETVTLTTAQMPAHSHAAVCAPLVGNVASPSAAYWSTDPQGNTAAYN